RTSAAPRGTLRAYATAGGKGYGRESVSAGWMRPFSAAVMREDLAKGGNNRALETVQSRHTTASGGHRTRPREHLGTYRIQDDRTMSDARLRGIVHLIEETKTYGQKGFRKRLVVLEQNNGRFTNYIPVEFTNDGCDRANELKVGDEAEITYRLTGRKWQKDPQSEVKYFLSAEAIS